MKNFEKIILLKELKRDGYNLTPEDENLIVEYDEKKAAELVTLIAERDQRIALRNIEKQSEITNLGYNIDTKKAI